MLVERIRICRKTFLVLQQIQDQNGFQWLRLEYALEGSSNYIAWKDRMEVVLEDNGLKEFIDNDVPKPVVIDAANLDAWKNKVAKIGRAHV